MRKDHCLSQLLLVAGFCLATTVSLVPAHAEVTLRMGVQPYLDDFWAGVAAGTFAKKGLKLEFQSFDSAAQTFPAFQADAIQMGVAGMAAYYVARANGLDIRWIATTATVNDSDACMVGPNSPIHSVADLKGKKIAFVFNSVVHGPILEMLKKNGLSSADVELLNLRPPIATAALLKGDVDLACNWGPFTYQIQDAGGKRLFTMADTPTGGWSYTGYAISAKFAREHPDAVVSFLQALQEGHEAYMKDKQPAINAVAKETGLDPKIAEQQSREVIPLPVQDNVKPDSRITMCGADSGKGAGAILQKAAEFYVENGTLKKILPFEDYLDPQYASAAFGVSGCTVK